MSDIAQQAQDNATNIDNEDEEDSQNKSVSLTDDNLMVINEGNLQIQMNAKIKGMDMIIKDAINEAEDDLRQIDKE